MARKPKQTETPKASTAPAAILGAAVEGASSGSQKPPEPASKPDAKVTGDKITNDKATDDKATGAKAQPQTGGQIDERKFVTLSRVKRNGARYAAGDPITLDRAGFEELKRFRVVAGTFEDGEPVKAPA